MDRKSAVGHRRSPSYDRLIGVFSPPDPAFSSSTSEATGDELYEDDVFYTTDFTERRQRTTSAGDNRLRQREKSGILAALTDGQRNLDGKVIVRKTTLPSSSTTPLSRAIPSIPKPHLLKEARQSQSLPGRRHQQSAPVNVPMMPRKERSVDINDLEICDGVDDGEILPPHEIVDRGLSQNQKNAFSVLEGVGRTLKGRDLRQVRNAVWRPTGFLD